MDHVLSVSYLQIIFLFDSLLYVHTEPREDSGDTKYTRGKSCRACIQRPPPPHLPSHLYPHSTFNFSLAEGLEVSVGPLCGSLRMIF